MDTIRDFFEDAVRESGAAVFLRENDGSAWHETTYARARDRALGILAGFLKLGLTDVCSSGQRARIAIMRENCAEWMLGYLALAGCGFVVVPVDPHLKAGEASHILTDSESSLVWADDALAAVLDEASTSTRIILASEFDRLLESLRDADLAAAARFWETHVPQAGDLASIVYTSGTTGLPKGAMLSHGNFTSNVDQTFSRVMFYETDHFLLVLPLFHVFAFTLDFLMPLRKRAQISLARSMRSVPADLAELHPTVFLAVPLLVELLYARARALITSLRVLGVGGAPISKGTLDDLIHAGVFVLEGYGITECAPGVSYPDEKRYVPGTVGMPLDGMEWRITNSDETGAGELRVKGPNVMRGYWKNPVETAKVFDEDGFYRTGDIVRPVLNGNFTICGRTKALIVNREGKNIYPEEIERVISRSPHVAEVIVMGYRVGNEVGERVGAIVVPNMEKVKSTWPAASQDETVRRVRADVQQLCHDLLAEYKLPRKIDVRFSPLERTASMKVRRFVYARALDE